MLTSAQFAAKEKINDVAWVRRLCVAGRIKGAIKIGRDWLIPDHARVTEVRLGRPPKR